MTTRFTMIAGVLLCSMPLCSAAALAPNDNDATARTLVSQCANIREGENVLISGRPSDMPLLECIAVQVRKVGAFPLISVHSDTMARRMTDEVPTSYDAQVNEFEMKLAGIVNAMISVESTENPSLFADVPPARTAAMAKAAMPVQEAYLKKNIRNVSLGNGLFPTDATAQMYGMDREQLSTIFWSGVNTDYTALQATGAKVKGWIEAGKMVHVTNPNGTDITFKVQGKPCFVSDGVISKEDASKGGAACQLWLPAGEVYGTPVSGTANGKVVVDHAFYQGKDITGITMMFKDGKMTSFTAASGFDSLKALYDAAGSGKDDFAFFDLGINPGVKAPAGTKFQSWVPAGMVTLGVGNNTWAGGTNSNPFGFSGFIPGSTVMVDDKTIVDKGTLK